MGSSAAQAAANFKRDIESMSAHERALAIGLVQDAIRAALYDDAASDVEEPLCCHRCGSVSVVRKGHARDGRQRYLCKDCGRTFTQGSGRVLGTSKLPASTWMAYAECFVLALPLRDCAAVCGVSLKTSFTMRHRLIEVVTAFSPAFAVGDGCSCELDETYFRESFKGNHAKGSFKMPRKPRRHGGKLHRRGLSKEQICVMTGISDAGELFLDLAGRGSLSADRARAALEGRVRSGAIVSTDRAHAYRGTLAELEVACHRAYDPKDRAAGTINRVNNVHSLLDSFMEGFRGVSTKHLGAYLQWFRWLRAFSTGDMKRDAGVVARQLAGTASCARVRDMFNVDPPYMEYWAA